MAHSNFSRIVVAAVIVLGAIAATGCGNKETEKPQTMQDVKLPPGQQFGYKPK